jgi:nitrogen fixation/metabolism regulation signal transduction histidine kinase
LQASETKLIEKQLTITDKDKLLKKYQTTLEVATDISGIDHDINNHLTIISLSVRRILKAAVEYKDIKLSKSAEQMTEAINQINKILREFQNFKKDPLIQKIRKRRQGN